MTGDRLIRVMTSVVVLAVAAFAAIVSYSHIFDLGRMHGQDGTAARLLPLSVDGLILAASLVLLHEARNGRQAPTLARWMLWLGIGATVGSNVAYGAAWGVPGALISAWPAVAFIGTVEMVMILVRRSRAAIGHDHRPPMPEVPSTVQEAARAAYSASIRGGNPLSERALADRFGITRPMARKLRTEVATTADGQSAAAQAGR